MKKSDAMRKLAAELAKKKPAKKEKKKASKKKASKKIDADVNKDGKVDEKDLGLVEKAVKAVKKKIVKKKD